MAVIKNYTEVVQMVYCMADIHGNYEAYQDILKQIHFKDSDTLYVLGDVVDRGPDSIKPVSYTHLTLPTMAVV